ncbi:hypothetical protein SeLEV6574_g07466, partial [Synchytrium endobioticum]
MQSRASPSMSAAAAHHARPGTGASHDDILLSLEPEEYPIVKDVTADGEELYEIPLTRSQRFARNVERIQIDKLRRPDVLPSADNTRAPDKAVEEKKNVAPIVYPTLQLFRAIQEAKAEMQQLNNTVDRFIFGTHGQYPSPPVSQDPSQLKILHAPGRPKEPRVEKQIENLQILMGAKNDALRSVADMLTKAAERLSAMVKHEHHFFNEYVPDMRKAGWFLETRLRTRANFEGGGMTPLPLRDYFVDYGYTAAGSTYEGCEALVVRRPGNREANTSEDVQLQLKHKKRRRVVVSVVDQLTKEARISSLQKAPIIGQAVSDQLRAARDTVFEMELFQRVLRDISSDSHLLHVSRISGKTISIPISDTRTLNFRLVNQATYRPPNDAIQDHDV